MLSVPLIALAQEKRRRKRRRRREEKKEEAEEKKDEAKDKAKDAATTRSSMAPGPITARTGGRIDGAMQSSDESFGARLLTDKNVSSSSSIRFKRPLNRIRPNYALTDHRLAES